MREFAELTRGGQFRRLRELATAALAGYDLPEPALTALQNEENATFRVDVADRARFLLRIHRPGLRTMASVESELRWLAAIRRDTGFGVPEPVPTRAGRLLVQVQVPGVPEPRICVLFRWVDGRFQDETLTPAQLQQVGMLMARLQLHGSTFGSPAGFFRERIGILTHEARGVAARKTDVVPARQPVGDPTDEARALDLVGQVRPADVELVRMLIDRAHRVQHELGQGPDAFGLIHGDLHQENFLFHRGEARAIDFDDCGYFYYLYDLAVPLSELSWRPGAGELRAGLLAGYCSVRELPPGFEPMLDVFIAFRLLQVIIWKIELREHPVFRDGWGADVDGMFGQIKGLLPR